MHIGVIEFIAFFHNLNEANADESEQGWDQILTEMCGDQVDEKHRIISAALADDRISEFAKL